MSFPFGWEHALSQICQIVKSVVWFVWIDDDFTDVFPKLLEHPLQVACRQVAPASQLPVAKLECWCNLKNKSDEEFSISHHPTLGYLIYNYVMFSCWLFLNTLYEQ